MSFMTPRQIGVFLLCVLSFYMGGGFEKPPDRTKPQRVEIKTTETVNIPYLPSDCREALMFNTNYDTDSEKATLVNSCVNEVGIKLDEAQREVIINNTFTRYQANESEDDDYTEEQIEEAFEACELEYEDTQFCEDDLDDFLEDAP